MTPGQAQEEHPMSLQEVVVEGTLKPDGTLELDRRPNLQPGRVTVVLRQEAETGVPPQEDWWQCLQRLRAEREAAGYPFMDEEETARYAEWLREPDAVDDLLREAEQGGREPGAS